MSQSRSQRQGWQYLMGIGGIAIAYSLVGNLAFALLDLQFEASPLWPPAGIALAAVIWYPRWAWIGVLLGAALVNQSLGASWQLSLGATLGSTLQPLVGALLLRQVRFCQSMDRLRDVLYFLAFAVCLTPSVSATINTVNGYAAGLFAEERVIRNGLTFWIGDGMGILVLTPLLLIARQHLQRRSLNWELNWDWAHWEGAQWGWDSQRYPSHMPVMTSRRSLIEISVWLVLVVSISWLVFQSPIATPLALYPLEYLPFPFVIWAALRFGQVSAVMASVILATIAMLGTLSGHGPFVAKVDDSRQVILLLQTFIGVIITTAMIVAAVMTTRRRAEAQLRLTAERNRLLGEMAMRIRQSLDLSDILQTTVEEVRRVLHTDRVLFCRFDADGRGEVVAESVGLGHKSALGWTTDAAVYDEIQPIFAGEQITVINNTAWVNLPSSIVEYHRCYQIQAEIAVPIFVDIGQCRQEAPCLFGVLVVNQCTRPRRWQPLEVGLLEQLGTQVAIAIQQAHLYQQVQSLNAGLERQVQERTLQLQANMAELEELNQLRDVFIHAIAHDLRTTVMGNLMVLQNLQTQATEQVTLSRSLLERMTQSGEVQLCKLNSLLEAYKSKTEGLELHREPIAPFVILQRVISELTPLFEKNQVHCQTHLTSTTPIIQGDAEQLTRVFRQLLLNAVKHNPPGIEITIYAEHRGDQIWFEICDTGQGIPATQRDRLFELRIGQSPCDRQLTGLSLGLYLCHQIVTAHGGTIGVESRVDEGTRVWLTLPAAAVMPQAPVSAMRSLSQ